MIHLTAQNLTQKELIQNVFAPLIGVVCSPQAEELCYKNNLTFVELLQPYSKLTNDAYFRDATGQSTSVKGIRLNICDINWRPPQTMQAKKMLTDTLTATQSDKVKTVKIDEQTFIDIPFVEPWFERWREVFLSIQSQSDHEFTRHFLSCLIVVSTSDPNSLETANALTRKVQLMQNVTPPKIPKWFSSDALNCYVLLHDPSIGDVTLAQQAFETLKLTFGENKCFLVQINSQQNPSSNNNIIDPWLKFLRRPTKSDLPIDSGSAPKTPQDVTNVVSMPTVQVSTLETPPSGSVTDEMVDHPLSPTQEQVADAIHSKFSSSCDSLSSQIVNPNVWTNESDIDLPHGLYLTASDIDNLKHLIQDFTIRSLIPYIEKQILILNETVANKKGVSRSLLSATKRWFVTNKPGVNNSQNVVVYSNDSLELQTRKLGDLYFMFGNYGQAFQAFHQAKRDFNVDSAWQYYAGALEMAALSAFMQGTANRKTYDYMEEAIVTYLNHCKLQQFATRATLLSVECLRMAKLYSEAAKQLIRMTSTDADMPSALLLEQAAHTFLKSNPPHYRKYAFHIVLAGHRYSKCGQKKHAFRCYKQAYQVFENRDWSLAEDHIQYTIGKQAVTLKKLDEASAALAHLLRPSSLQSSAQQSAFLREYIATQKIFLKQCNGTSDTLLEISLPKIASKSVRVLVTSPPPVTTPSLVSATNININSSLDEEWKWQKLEEIALQSASTKSIMFFKSYQSLFTSQMPTSECPLSVQGEPIEISFALENAIKPSITFEDINLLWTFTNESGEVFTNLNLFQNDVSIDGRNSIYNIVASTFIKSIQLNEHEKKVVVMKLTPRFTGQLEIKAVVGKISATKETSSLWGKLNFEATMIRPDGPSAADKPRQYDKKLNLTILPPAPALHVSFTPIPQDVLAGEIISVSVNLMNAGAQSLTHIYVVAEEPRWILGELNSQELPLSLLRDYKDLTNEALSRDKEARKQHAFKLFSSSGGGLQPKESKTSVLWLQAPFKKDQTTLKLLFYYGTPDSYPKIRYRLVRHTWNINVNESLSLDATCSLSSPGSSELGLDIFIRNLNQVHHPLMTEISLSDIRLFCSVYKLNSKKLNYLQSPGYNRVIHEGGGLRINESISFRCALDKTESKLKPNSALEFIQNRLSTLAIKSFPDIENVIPNTSNLESFLMKNETKYIGVLRQTNNSEEFNNIVSTHDPHMTVVLTWRAIVMDNNSSQRLAFGQHFVQLRHLYDPVSCPFKEKVQQTTFAEHEDQLSIYNFGHILGESNVSTEDTFDEDNQWSTNDISVVMRCFLEVEEENTPSDTVPNQA